LGKQVRKWGINLTLLSKRATSPTGQSVTDSCVSFPTTEAMLTKLAVGDTNVAVAVAPD
jgi:3-deoxy-D-arabino-heptulosonate 7-phosphate (DAHP) synthase